MTFPDDASARPAPAMGPTPQMMPGARPGEVHAETVDAVDPELAESIPVRVRELLGQVDDIREQSGEAIDLVALARQTQLLEQAHEVLTSALSDVDRR
ncbi:hypothetical protein GOPIP_013_00020 [Gordonia polyisoprenivorans NBRC 16320 = JCM 10675]|uniref:Uncharacterized protein n=1 Tax=Gordonia polyisoprenivorans TaxID=84595 RepID=A0A846WV03_9ACTN|nr:MULTISPECIES: hypothetical protein [Gordonia]MBE7194558.1 hypothetical protein [Gordonia polyisoprenivorans]MDF3283391.1 hypothetical protein [Gordonia sp. N1V]NKY05325.1 hypothetical protein [Gordonia polyisoprenivorans]OZC30767.1 hypothetical protein CJJ17_04325 [Gordonia polyisoprenivorans]UZF54021.1 hypothetical protein LH935_14725 [Gordonia polyisoprenivorans]